MGRPSPTCSQSQTELALSTQVLINEVFTVLNELSRKVRLSRKSVEAEGICSFELVDPQGGSLPQFSAGAHIQVNLGGGIVRPYSLCNDPAETHRYVIAVLLEPESKGGSSGMHALKEGDIIQISDPRNHFHLVENAARHLLIAGGIGITPLLAMAWRLWRIGAEFELHVCARMRSRAAFVHHSRAAPFADRMHFHFDDGPDQQKFDLRGVLTACNPSTHLYVCGPGGFMSFVLGGARSEGWSEERLHFESFSGDIAIHEGDGPFEVEIASSGEVIQIAAGQSVVHVLFDHGIDVPVSCEAGVCGTCVTGVLGGVPDHRDMYLTPEEQGRNDQFLPCCSRAKTARLVLDL